MNFKRDTPIPASDSLLFSVLENKTRREVDKMVASSYTMTVGTTYQCPYKPTPTSTHLDRFIRWLRLRKYRIEVTYGVYVFTPGEKAVFWTLFFLFFILIITAIGLYAHRSIKALAHAAAAYIDFPVLVSGDNSLLSHLVTASIQHRGAGKARELMSGAAKNSQVV